MFILYNGNSSGFRYKISNLSSNPLVASRRRDSIGNGVGENKLRALKIPLEDYREIEKEADSYKLKAQYEQFARAFEGVGNPIRFIGMDAAIENVETAGPSQQPRRKSWSPTGWKVDGPVGEGGQAWTYLVRRVDGTDRALYVAKRLKNKNRLARFQAEIDALKKLSHPGVLTIVETGVSEDLPFFIAEYCHAGDLSKLDLSSKDFLQRLQLYREVCDAMAVAHEAKIIHRDLKPPNVLVRSNGSLAIGDFGLCLDLTDIEERLTSTTEAVGARHYIAPELEDGRIDNPQPSSDVYSLGKLLYFILSGRSFSREQHRAPVYNLLGPNPHLHFAYELLDKTIDANPGARYQNAAELLKALDGVIMRVEQNAHVLDLKVTQHCLYCVSGEYRRMQAAGNEDLELALICGNCGNIQRFSKQHSGARNWWHTR